MIINNILIFDEYIFWLMSSEMDERLTSVETSMQQQQIQTIKSSKKKQVPEQGISPISSIIEENTTDIIEKIDSKLPTYVQLYSDLYKKYLRMASNFFDASYLSQKEVYDKMGISDARFAMFETYLRSVKKMILLQIDLSENMIKSYVSHRLTFLEFCDQMTSRNISNFAKMCPMSYSQPHD